jgi:ribosome biogenesis ATPase
MCFVGLPGGLERAEIFKALSRRVEQFDGSLANFAITDACNGFTGADLDSLLTQAGQAALDRDGTTITLQDFESVVQTVRKSVSNSDALRYEKMKEKYESKN